MLNYTKNIYLLTIISLMSACAGQVNLNECPFGLLPNTEILITLVEEDSTLNLIGDGISGSIYNYKTSRLLLNNEPVSDGLRDTRLRVNDWHDPLITDSLLTLEYIVELPLISSPIIVRDTLKIEYTAIFPMDCTFEFGGTDSRQLSFIRVSYNGDIHFEGTPRSSDITIRLDRICLLYTSPSPRDRG